MWVENFTPTLWRVLTFIFSWQNFEAIFYIHVMIVFKSASNCTNFYARQQNTSRVLAIVWASVCLSVRLSVTLVSCIKTVQARITKFSLWVAPRSLVYRHKISCHWVQGFPSNECVEEGCPPPKKKWRHFAVTGSNNVKTVADRYIHAAYHNKHWWQAFWIHKHRWPWTTLNLWKRGF